MRSLRGWLVRLTGLFHKERRDKELAAEIESHLQIHVDDNLRSGMSPEEARRNALMKLGGIEQTKESYRDRRGLPHLETLWQDVRYGARILRKKPGFTCAAVLLLALGIGLNSAIFSMVYAVLLKPLPFRDADRLVFIQKKNPPRGWARNPISPAEFLEWRKASQAFEDMAAFTGNPCVLTGSGEPEEEWCETAESHLFPVLGVSPIQGRTFLPEEDAQGGPRTALLSYGLWQRRFGGEDGVLGKTITVNGSSYTVVGVMPAGIAHLYASPYSHAPQMWLSGIALSPTRTGNEYNAVARLSRGATLKQAETEMDSVSASIDVAFPDLKGWRADPLYLREKLAGDVRPTLLLLLGAVTFVLLIACANVANLMLARGAERSGEFAVRKALGASQLRLIRQVLTESLLVSLAGGGLGVLLALWGKRGIATLAPQMLLSAAPGLTAGGLEARVLAFTFGIALATTLLFGLAPALRSAGRDASDDLKEAGRSSLQSGGGRYFRNGLVSAEIALSMVLLVGAGLMIRTLGVLGNLNLGFDPLNVLTMRVPVTGARYKEPQAVAEFWRQVVASVERLPGVESASVARGLPMEGWAGQFFTTGENPSPPAGQVPDANYVVVSPDYFRTLRTPIRAGRVFAESDGPNAEHVAIVNEELARRSWPGANPVGKRIRVEIGPDTPWMTVVGVAGNVLSQGPDSGFNPEIYVPYQQYPWVQTPRNLIVRARSGFAAASVAAAIEREVHRVDPGQPVAEVKTMEEVAAQPLAQQRMVMALLGAFAALALILSAVGIYSVQAYSVAQRTREIGVRMALGAQPRDVLQMVLGGGTLLLAAGIAAGSAAALALTRLMSDLLFGVRPTDPATFASVAVFLGLVSLVACYLPARRAAKVDPMTALRYE